MVHELAKLSLESGEEGVKEGVIVHNPGGKLPLFAFHSQHKNLGGLLGIRL